MLPKNVQEPSSRFLLSCNNPTASMPRSSTDHQEDAFLTFPLDGKFPRVGIYSPFPLYPTRNERPWTNQCT